MRLVVTLAPPRRTLNDSGVGGVATATRALVRASCDDIGEEEAAEEWLFKGHAEHEVDAEKEEGVGS